MRSCQYKNDLDEDPYLQKICNVRINVDYFVPPLSNILIHIIVIKNNCRTFLKERQIV